MLADIRQYMLVIIFCLTIIKKTSGVSYNQPKLCPTATWDPDAKTLAKGSLTISEPSGIFVDSNNTVYVTDYASSGVSFWMNDGSTPTSIAATVTLSPRSIFVTMNGDIFVDTANPNYRVVKWSPDTNTQVSAMIVNSQCYGLFVDINDTLYCSLYNDHEIVKRWLGSSTTTGTTAAGTGSKGSDSNTFFCPWGIFVDIDFDLYVADSGNDRIQLFRAGQLSGTTVAGNTSSTTTITLKYPSGVVLDADKYLFIVDQDDNRIVGSGPNGFRCIVGCSGQGSSSNALSSPRSLSFDSFGSIFVTDYRNARIQKFLLSTNLCDETTTTTTQMTMIVPTTAEFQATTVPDTAEFQVTTVPDTAEFQATTVPDTAEFQATTVPDTAESQATTVPDTAESQVTTVPDTAEFQATTIPDTAEFQATTVPDTAEFQATSIPTTAELQTMAVPSTIEFLVTNVPSIAEFQATTIPTTAEFQATTVPSATEFQTSTIPSTTETEITILSATIEIQTTSFPITMKTRKDEITTVETTTQIEGEQVSTMATTITSFISNQTCQPSVIILIPETSPLEIRRSEDIYISSNIDFICNDSYSIVIKWTIHDSSQTELDIPKVERTYRELYIPSLTLSFGLYEFKLIVTTIPLSTTIESKSLFVRIIPSDITVNLIHSSTSLITHGHEQSLKLNPGSYSIDHDGYAFNATNWIYKYYCRIHGLDFLTDLSNSSCLSNSSGFKYDDDLSKSSVTIDGGLFKSNVTYQFLVELINRANVLSKFTGSLLVQIEEHASPTIFISCLISMCHHKSDYQLINPTAQIALSSSCLENCSSIENIQWKVYRGSFNTTQWTQTNVNDSRWFYGLNTKTFTATKELFRENSAINSWRFEVIYKFSKGQSSSSMIFHLNECPSNGSCSINPIDGSLFTISCENWFDKDQIKDYSIYFWTNDYSKQTIIGFSSVPTFQVRLPFINEELKLIIKIRDQYDCQSEFNLSTNRTENDFDQLYSLIHSKQVLVFNQNQLNQLIFSFTKQLNEKVKNISSDEMKNYSYLREYLMNLTARQIFPHSDLIQLQASTIVQLTQVTEQLTRLTLMDVANKCYHLVLALNSISRKTAFEDLQLSVVSLAQCTANVHSAIHEISQQRTVTLNDDDEDLLYQKEILNKIQQTRLSLTSTINNHLNLGQNFQINTSEIIMSFEKITNSNKQYKNEFFSFPLNFTHSNQTILIQSTSDRLAPYRNRFTSINSSQSVSLSVFDEDEKKISIENHFIQMLIPRHPNLEIPPMILQNVTSLNKSSYLKLINFKNIQSNGRFAFSIHFQISPLKKNISYLFSYQFDQTKQFIHSSDRSILFCPSNLTSDNLYIFYLDNEQTANHYSLIFSLKELDGTDCHRNSVFTHGFTSNFYLRIYTSGCFYLDQNNDWQSDGLIVGPKTNINETQCFSSPVK